MNQVASCYKERNQPVNLSDLIPAEVLEQGKKIREAIELLERELNKGLQIEPMDYSIKPFELPRR